VVISSIASITLRPKSIERATESHRLKARLETVQHKGLSSCFEPYCPAPRPKGSAFALVALASAGKALRY
jgi:hypothetical protein